MKSLVCCAAILTVCSGFAGETAFQSVGDSICAIDRVEKAENESTAVDFTLRPEKESEICCRIILPPKAAWNGELWGVGNDSCGGVIPSVKSFLGVGNAVVTTDLGTRRYVSGDRRGKPWPEAVFKDYSWRATHLMTVYGKKIVQAQYGIPPKQSYFCGGSCGGRQGFSEVMRFPADYDGVIATIPAAAKIAQNAQILNLYRQTHDETGRELFTTNQLRILADAPIEYMKDKDVAPYAGSILSNPFFSEKDIDGMLALAAKRDPSLAAPDLMRRMKGIFLGAKDSQGRTLCHGMMPGAFHGNRYGANFRSKGLCLAAVLRDGDRYSTYPSWEEFEQKAVRRGAEINSVSTDLSAFARRGGKLIVTCGWEDQTTPAPETVAWYENLAEDNGGYGKVQDYCRLFPLPGTAHGGGKGRITTGGSAVGRLQHDLLRRWVTNGVAPETFPLKWPAKKLTLPIPPYPLQCYLGADGKWKTRRYPENMVRHPDRRLYRTDLSTGEGSDGDGPKGP